MSIEMSASASACLSVVVGVLSMLSISSLFLSLYGSLSMSHSLLFIWKGNHINYLVGRGSSDLPCNTPFHKIQAINYIFLPGYIVHQDEHRQAKIHRAST